jgi:uncharacterized phage protein (TIGR01671 family)
MSRTIKFRAWDKVCKEMFYNSELSNGDMMVMCLDGEIQLSDDDTYKPSDFELMQCTGLKDKNGKEIYEGDILYFTVFDYNGSDTQYKGVIKWIGSRFAIWHDNEQEYYGSDGAFDLDWVCSQDDEPEIIGNIWETPELIEALEGKKHE